MNALVNEFVAPTISPVTPGATNPTVPTLPQRDEAGERPVGERVAATRAALADAVLRGRLGPRAGQ